MYDAGCDAYGMSRCFGYVCMMNDYVMQMLECFDDSTICLCRLHCLYKGLMEPMIVLVVSLSAPEYGGRYSDDGLVEPMNRIRRASASELSSGRIIRTAG